MKTNSENKHTSPLPRIRIELTSETVNTLDFPVGLLERGIDPSYGFYLHGTRARIAQRYNAELRAG
jgi:hypothetical protein